MRARYFILSTVLVVSWTPPAAHAQSARAQPRWLASPYLHVNGGEVEIRRGGLGGSIAYLGSRLGFELDVDRHHHIFKDKELDFPNNCGVTDVAGPCVDLNTDAWIVMGNVLAQIPTANTAKWRPYAAAGLGVVHAWIHEDGSFGFESEGEKIEASQTDLAFTAGGGVVYWLNGWIGLRGDLRYFHAFVSDDEHAGVYYEDYDFGRLALGFTFGLPQ